MGRARRGTSQGVMRMAEVFMMRAVGACGVVLDAAGFEPADMQKIAAAVGASETAFVCPSERADVRLRFFTPLEEVPLCGHATVAAFALMFERNVLSAGEYRQEIGAGVLPVRVYADGRVKMSQARPVFGEFVRRADAAAVLGCAEELLVGLPPQIVSTGLRDVFVAIRDRAALLALQPDFAAMSRLNAETNSLGFHVYTRDTISPLAAAHCRNFAPLVGIEEEAATGSASGALAALLFARGAAGPVQEFEQGHAIGAPSSIRAELELQGEEIAGVGVSGTACFAGVRCG